jgi:hypothetical protein
MPMAAIAEEPIAALPRTPVPPRAPRKVRAEGIRIDATRTAVFDVLVDPDTRKRWLGASSRVVRASLSLYEPRVRTSVTVATVRPDGVEVALTFVLHAVPFATIVELHHAVREGSSGRPRSRGGWRAAHWRRRCLDALRHEVEGREPGRLRSRRRNGHLPSSPR